MRNIFNRPVFGVHYNDLERRRIIDSSRKTYVYLQENFKEIGMFEGADSIYLERKRMEAEYLTDWRNWRDWWKIAWNWVLDRTCNYGTDFQQIVGVCFAIISSFTGLYFLTFFPHVQKRLGTIEAQGKWSRSYYDGNKYAKLIHLWHAFYLSVNSFTTLGTGDIIVTGLFLVLVILEGALGWFMLGLFIVVLASQYFR